MLKYSATRWVFSREEVLNSPSKQDGISFEKELWNRCVIADAIDLLARRLPSPPKMAVNTAIIYMHRFYQVQSLRKFPREIMVPVFLWLACKVEEQPRSVKSIIYHWSYASMSKEKAGVAMEAKNYDQTYEEMTMLEECLMQELGFSFTVDSPYYELIEFMKSMNAPEELQKCATIILISCLYYTPLCVRFTAPQMAASCLLCAMTWMEVEYEQSDDEEPWYKQLDYPTILQGVKAIFEYFSALDKRFKMKFFIPDRQAFRPRANQNAEKPASNKK